jgi:hypothetical protein
MWKESTFGFSDRPGEPLCLEERVSGERTGGFLLRCFTNFMVEEYHFHTATLEFLD